MSNKSKSLIKSLLNFTKVEHTIFSVPLLFSAAFMSNGNKWPEAKIMVCLILAATGARILGMAMNRIIDRHIDCKNPRTRDRELPSRRLSPNKGYIIAAGGLLVYLTACIVLGKLPLYLSPIPVIILIGYSYLKRVTCLCHFGIGVVISLAPLGSFVAVTGTLTPPVSIILLTIFAFLWISGFDIIYGLLDIEFDQKNGIHSIPARFGYKGAVWISLFVHLMAFVAIALLAFSEGSTTKAAAINLILLIATGGAFILANSELLPVEKRFFPISAITGVCGALIPLI